MSIQPSSECARQATARVTPWPSIILYPLAHAKPELVSNTIWHILKACVDLNHKAGAVHGDVTPDKMAIRKWRDKAIGALIDYDICVSSRDLEEGEHPATGGVVG